MKAAVIAAVKDVANHAGDASGNADSAVAMMGRYGDIDRVIESLEWARDQSARATRAAAAALEKVRSFKAQGGAA